MIRWNTYGRDLYPAPFGGKFLREGAFNLTEAYDSLVPREVEEFLQVLHPNGKPITGKLFCCKLMLEENGFCTHSSGTPTGNDPGTGPGLLKDSTHFQPDRTSDSGSVWNRTGSYLYRQNCQNSGTVRLSRHLALSGAK
jgi:hypothetical protein